MEIGIITRIRESDGRNIEHSLVASNAGPLIEIALLLQ